LGDLPGVLQQLGADEEGVGPIWGRWSMMTQWQGRSMMVVNAQLTIEEDDEGVRDMCKNMELPGEEKNG
jgi:hypothetical protein